MAAEPQAAVPSELDRLAGTLPALGIAVSGGGDSMALLHLAAGWARARGIRIEAATVDHALRPESVAEARAVAAACAALGVPHAVLRWDHGGEIAGNLMAGARAARLRLLGGWARARGIGAVALGHTMDDQAETLLMRMARGAGVDGLSGMAPARPQDGLLWLRPMLGVRREALRGWLTERGIGWTDDPTNEDAAFDRVRVRQTIAALDLPVAQLARSAAALAEARAALAETAAVVAEGAQADRGMLRLPAAVLVRPAEIRRRLIAAALRWVTGADYPPRGEDLARLVDRLAHGGQATLDGAILRVRRGWVEALREPAAAGRAVPADAGGAGTRVWDRRWRLCGLSPDAQIRASSPAELAARDWRAAGLPRPALLSAPAVVTDAGVVLPLLDAGSPLTAQPLRGMAEYLAFLRSH